MTHEESRAKKGFSPCSVYVNSRDPSHVTVWTQNLYCYYVHEHSGSVHSLHTLFHSAMSVSTRVQYICYALTFIRLCSWAFGFSTFVTHALSFGYVLEHSGSVHFLRMHFHLDKLFLLIITIGKLPWIKIQDQMLSNTDRPLSVCKLLHFPLLLQNHRANFNQTWHKSFFGEGN
jgi:hypothetical protein